MILPESIILPVINRDTPACAQVKIVINDGKAVQGVRYHSLIPAINYK